MQPFLCLALLCSLLIERSTSAELIPPLRKLTVVSSNNQLLDKRYLMIPLPPSLSGDYFKSIRKDVDDSLKLTGMSELDVLRALCSWTHRQWVHDGRYAPSLKTSALQILEQAKSGQRFNCEGYARVLMDVLLAHGYVARTIYLKTKDAAYSAPGQGHVAVSVYSNVLRKWIYVDPQFDGMIFKGGVPMSWTEVRGMIHTPAADSLVFASSMTSAADYRAFLSAYDGYVTTLMMIDGIPELVTLPFDTTSKQFLTFQGLPADGNAFTFKQSDLYMPVNGVSMVFYSAKPANYDSILHKYKISTVDDYMRYMPLFSGVPKYSIRLSHAMPWFQGYEFAIDDGEWKRIRGTTVNVTFHDGLNTIRARAVNEMGVPGPETRMQIMYE